MKAKTRRVVSIGDLHCGHFVGLTPPLWQDDIGKENSHRNKIARVQHECWNWYAAKAKAIGPVDLLIVNGDMIDGDGSKSGGTEQITTDRKEQARMAVQCLKVWKAERYIFTFGTGYHTGNAEDFEEDVAEAFGAKIGGHEWVEVNGVTFDIKHHVGSSAVPHTRHTAVARDKLWSDLWALEGEQPKCDILLRSHVHYFNLTGGFRNGKLWMAMTLPALQAAGTKFGRRCSGTVDYGFMEFNITPEGAWSWQPHVVRMESSKALAWKVFA